MAVSTHALAAPLLLGLLTAGSPALAEGLVDRFNGWADAINHGLSAGVVAPTRAAAQALPTPAQGAAANVYANLTEPVSALSWAMAGDAGNAARSAARFSINTTAGMLGVLDVASAVGLPPRKKHFAEGLCALGIPPGPYLVVPGVGPSAVGVFLSGLTVMAGSTYALSFVSLELALGSAGVDLIGVAAALESLSTGSPPAPEGRRAAYLNYLAQSGCDVPNAHIPPS